MSEAQMTIVGIDESDKAKDALLCEFKNIFVYREKNKITQQFYLQFYMSENECIYVCISSLILPFTNKNN